MLRCKVYQDGDLQTEVEIDEEVIKVGKLKSSHLYLDGDGVARMHAVIERQGDNEYQLIDLGSFNGSQLNGEKIDKIAMLTREGTLRFGSFEVKYEIVDEPAKRQSRDDPSHHQKMLSSLIAELERVDPEAAKQSRNLEVHWFSLNDQRKREWLKLLVRGIREGRATNELVQRKRVATMMNLGMEGIEKVFELSQEEALVAAHEMLLDMAMSKQALTMLDSMGFLEAMREALEKMPESQRTEALNEYEMFNGAHVQLVDRLQTAIVAGTSILPLYLSRAGGREATEADRAQWKAAFDQITKAKANGAN